MHVIQCGINHSLPLIPTDLVNSSVISSIKTMTGSFSTFTCPSSNQLTSLPSLVLNHPSFDLALCNDFNLVEHFDVLEPDILLSDHAPISVSLHTLSPPSSALTLPKRQIWNTTRDNIPWHLFQSHLSSFLTSWHHKWSPSLSHLTSFSQSDIDTCWSELRDMIITAAHYVIGKKTVSSSSKHWFTIDPSLLALHRTYIKQRRARTGRAHNLMPTTPYMETQYRRARAAWRHAMRDAKDRCWHELVEQA